MHDGHRRPEGRRSCVDELARDIRIAAIVTHDASRALDPQGHIHAVVANLTRDPKGTWKALWNGEIWKNNTTIGQFYHAAFRAQLQKLGYETEAAGKHFFEDTWKVAPEADRIGYRFKGGDPNDRNSWEPVK